MSKRTLDDRDVTDDEPDEGDLSMTACLDAEDQASLDRAQAIVNEMAMKSLDLAIQIVQFHSTRLETDHDAMLAQMAASHRAPDQPSDKSRRVG